MDPYKKENIAGLSDLELVSKYKRSGDKIYIGELFERYTRFVFLVSMKYFKDEEQSKDASMQIFEKLFTDLKKHQIQNFKSWLYTVTKNHCLIQIRGEKYRTVYEADLKKDHYNYMESGNYLYLDNEKDDEKKLIDLEDAILLLSEEQRICIELFYLKEKSYDEVAEITGYNSKKVKSYIQNGKRNLKNILKEKNE